MKIAIGEPSVRAGVWKVARSRVRQGRSLRAAAAGVLAFSLLIGGGAVAQPGAPSEGASGFPAGGPFRPPKQAAAPTASASAPIPLRSFNPAEVGREAEVTGIIIAVVDAPADSGGGLLWNIADPATGNAAPVWLPASIGTPPRNFIVQSPVQVRGTVRRMGTFLVLTPKSLLEVAPAPANSTNGIVWRSDAVSEASSGFATTSTAKPPSASASGPGSTAFAGLTITPGQVTRDMIGQNARVTGRVIGFDKPSSAKAPWRVKLEGGGAVIQAVLWDDVKSRLTNFDTLTRTGTMVAISGVIGEHNRELQLRISNPDHIQVLREGAGTVKFATKQSEAMPDAIRQGKVGVTTPPSKITKADLGKTVLLGGVVKKVILPRNDRTPYRVDVGDESGGTIQVVYWSDLAEAFSGEHAPQEGKPWRVSGVVGEFNGRLQLKASNPLGQ